MTSVLREDESFRHTPEPCGVADDDVMLCEALDGLAVDTTMWGGAVQRPIVIAAMAAAQVCTRRVALPVSAVSRADVAVVRRALQWRVLRA
jgi:hypothetical protein